MGESRVSATTFHPFSPIARSMATSLGSLWTQASTRDRATYRAKRNAAAAPAVDPAEAETRPQAGPNASPEPMVKSEPGAKATTPRA